MSVHFRLTAEDSLTPVCDMNPTAAQFRHSLKSSFAGGASGAVSSSLVYGSFSVISARGNVIEKGLSQPRSSSMHQ